MLTFPYLLIRTIHYIDVLVLDTDSDELSDDDALFYDALDRVFPETDSMFTVSPRATLRHTYALCPSSSLPLFLIFTSASASVVPSAPLPHTCLN